MLGINLISDIRKTCYGGPVRSDGVTWYTHTGVWYVLVQSSTNCHIHYPDVGAHYIIPHLPRPFFSFFCSLALFAFWLRSSVVSVLFSLISEILLREKSMIKFIFVPGKSSSGLAHDILHCVPGLTLSLGDATSSFSSMFSACLGSWGRITLGICEIAIVFCSDSW